MDKSKKFWSWLENLINLYTLLVIIGIFSGGGAVMTYLNELPIWIPIILGILAVGLIAIALTNIIIKYKHWKATLEERKKILEEKRTDILSIPETLWKLSVEQLNNAKILMEKGVSEGIIKELRESIKLRFKLPSNMLPRTIKEDMETTFKVLKKRDIKISKPQKIMEAGLIIGWILDDRKVGIGVSTITIENVRYLETKDILETKQLPKVSTEELKDAITMFRSVLRSGDSAFVAKSYFIGRKTPDELANYDTGLPEFEHMRESDIHICLTEIRQLAEKECESLGG